MSNDLLASNALSFSLLRHFEIRPVRKDQVEEGWNPFADKLKRLIRLRRAREAAFGDDLFADPAWDMMLDLCLAAERGRRVSVSSLCIAASVPPTTALRWIKAMEDRNLVSREADPKDGRRMFVSLAPTVQEKLKELLSQWFGLPEGDGRVSIARES